MIIPIRCFTCGKVLAHLWEPYIEEVQKLKNKYEKNKSLNNTEDLIHLEPNIDKSVEGQSLDKLKITRYCCRKTMISTVELAEEI